MSKGWITAPKLFGRLSTRWSGGLILLIVVIAVAAALLERRERQGYRSTLVPGDSMPVYTAVSVDGTEVSISGPIALLHIRVFFGSLAHEITHVHAAVPNGGRCQEVV